MALRGSATQPNTTASTTCSVSVGGIGIQSGDIVVLFMNGGGSGTANFTFPSGFAAISGLTNINLGSGFNTLGIAAKVAGGSEPSSYSVTSDQNDFQTLHCRVYSGRNASSPFSTVALTPSSGGFSSFPISVSANGVTGAAGDDVVLLLGATGNASAPGETQSLTGPTGFSNQGALDGQVSFSPCVAYADDVGYSGGATGTLTAVWASSTGGNPIAYGGYVLSLAGAQAAAYAQPRPTGPGISPDKRTMLSSRQLSAVIAPNTLGGGVSSWQAVAYGQLTGALSAPIIGLWRGFGPGPSPDYKRTFQRPALSTNTPIIAALTGVSSWQASAYGNVVATASIQGVASWQGGSTAASLTGVGAMTGLATWQAAGLGNLGNGVLNNITGVASWQGGAFGAITGVGVLTGLASAQAAGYGAVTGVGVLTGMAAWEGRALGSLAGTAVAIGIASWQATAVGSLSGTAALQGRANIEGHTLGAVLGSGALGGVASWSGGAYGTVSGSGALTGLASGQSGAFGSMTGAVQISGLASWQGFTRGLLLPVGAGQMQGFAAAFSYAYGALTGFGHAFGWATVTALSQNGLPVARACYIEESASRVTASFFDASGIPFVPNVLRYRIDDVSSGAVILDWANLVPEVSIVVVVTSAENAMISLSRSSESHQVLFEITDGFGNVFYADVSYDVIRVAGLA